jgi:hypothetical protein
MAKKKLKYMAIAVEEIGRFAVDSGTCYIGDPWYLVNRHDTINDENDIKRWGVLADRFGGDGGYAVYGEYDGSKLTRLVIDFTDDNKYPKLSKNK